MFQFKCRLPGCTKLVENDDDDFCCKEHGYLNQQMSHPKTQRVLQIEAGLKAGGCPMSQLANAVGEILIQQEVAIA